MSIPASAYSSILLQHQPNSLLTRLLIPSTWQHYLDAPSTWLNLVASPDFHVASLEVDVQTTSTHRRTAHPSIEHRRPGAGRHPHLRKLPHNRQQYSICNDILSFRLVSRTATQSWKTATVFLSHDPSMLMAAIVIVIALHHGRWTYYATASSSTLSF